MRPQRRAGAASFVDLTCHLSCGMAPGMHLTEILAELLQGYRHPAVVIDDRSVVVCTNGAADRFVTESPPMDPGKWPHVVAFADDKRKFYLRMPARTPITTDLPTLPPRLAKVAHMVVAGHTDKQIAARTGLTFSTIRTYVRQVYRRLGVHNRVALVHALTPARPESSG